MATTQTTSKKAAKNNAVKAAVIVQPGPRGFRFGFAFVMSVINGEGIAAKEANKAKVVQFAKELGVEGVTMKTETATALKLMKKAAQKFRNANWEASPTVH